MTESKKLRAGSLFEGIVSFRAVVESGSRPITELFYDAAKLPKNGKEFGYLKAKSVERGFPITLCERSTLDEMAVGSSHGGILFTCGERQLLPVSTADFPKNGFFALLDGIEDPYNFGFALRSLYAAGVDGVLLPKRNWMSAAGIVCRASAGASERLLLREFDPDSLPGLLPEGYRLICADMKHAVPVYEANLQRPLLLAIGGEKRGIGSRLLAAADQVVLLEYGREFPAALSAASAAAILGFEVLRQNRR